MKTDWERYVPPGIDLSRERRLCLTGLGLAVLYSFLFIIRFVSALTELYVWNGQKHVLDVNQHMRKFTGLVEGIGLGFTVFALCMAALAVYHYIYHYQGSKSIYLMRRLPVRSELYIRCIALPFAAIMAAMLCLTVLLLLYSGIYILFTPKPCMAPGQPEGLINAFKEVFI